MKTSLLLPSVLLAAALAGSGALAQDTSTQAPTTPAPVALTPPPPITVNGVVYTEKLPTPTSLLKDAETEGLKIVRMDQSPDRLVVVYQYPDNSTRTFAYTTSVGVAQSVAVASAPVRVVANPTGSTASYTVISEPAPGSTTVVYAQPDTVYYTEPSPVYYAPSYGRYNDPVWDGWAPLAVGLGLGIMWHDGYHGGFHDRDRGDFHGGHRGWRH